MIKMLTNGLMLLVLFYGYAAIVWLTVWVIKAVIAEEKKKRLQRMLSDEMKRRGDK